jgi:hypothetical protein
MSYEPARSHKKHIRGTKKIGKAPIFGAYRGSRLEGALISRVDFSIRIIPQNTEGDVHKVAENPDLASKIK